MAGAVVYTSRLPKVYEAKASVQIEPRLPDLLGQGAELLAMGAGGMDYYRQQKQVLSSYTVTRQTVEQNSAPAQAAHRRCAREHAAR